MNFKISNAYYVKDDEYILMYKGSFPSFRMYFFQTLQCTN